MYTPAILPLGTMVPFSIQSRLLWACADDALAARSRWAVWVVKVKRLGGAGVGGEGMGLRSGWVLASVLGSVEFQIAEMILAARGAVARAKEMSLPAFDRCAVDVSRFKERALAPCARTFLSNFGLLSI